MQPSTGASKAIEFTGSRQAMQCHQASLHVPQKMEMLEIMCCNMQEMELGSHPDLETVPEDFASISDMVGPAAGEGASLIASLGDGGCSSVESNNNLRRLLLKQLPSEEVSRQLLSKSVLCLPPKTAEHDHSTGARWNICLLRQSKSLV